MTPLSITREQIKLTLLAADIPVRKCSANLSVLPINGKYFTFAPLVDFQWSGFLNIPIAYRVLFVSEPFIVTPDVMAYCNDLWPEPKVIFVGYERPRRLSSNDLAQWFTVEEFIQAVENIPKSGNPFSLKLELDNAHRTNAEQQVTINRLQLEVERLRLRVSDGE